MKKLVWILVGVYCLNGPSDALAQASVPRGARVAIEASTGLVSIGAGALLGYLLSGLPRCGRRCRKIWTAWGAVMAAMISPAAMCLSGHLMRAGGHCLAGYGGFAGGIQLDAFGTAIYSMTDAELSSLSEVWIGIGVALAILLPVTGATLGYELSVR